VLSYTLFLLSAGLAGWTQVMTSFLHLWQVNHSITIFFGIWLGYHALVSLKPWLGFAGAQLGLSNKDFSELVNDTLNRYGSPWSSLFALPFIFGGLGVAFLIARDLPNKLFPFPGYLPAFIYTVFIELCIFMLYLLGATGFWLLYVFTKAAAKLSRTESVDYTLVDQESMNLLSNTILRLCLFLLIIIASAMPGVAFIVFSFKNSPLVLALGIMFGMVLPTTGLILSFFAPNYYMHRMLAEAKSRQMLCLKEQIRICEGILQKRIIEMSNTSTATHHPDDENLLRLIQFLRDRLAETQRASDWPFNLSSILKLAAASMLPITTFFSEQLIRRVFS
jgi:hypothetical protein